MSSLVTGAAGCIGTSLCITLLQKGYKVIGVDNLITGSLANVNQLHKYPNFTFIKHDITNPLPQKLTTYNLQPTTIFHLACPTGVPNLLPMAEAMLLTSIIGTKNLLDLARAHKAKFLFTSSSEVYGDPQISPQTETYWGHVNPHGVRSPYEEGKRMAESLIMTYVKKYKINALVVRVFNTYGPHASANETRVIPRFLRLAINNQPLTVHGDGKQKRTFCYVDDLVHGLFTVMAKGEPGEVYNLGSDKQVTIKKLAELIIKVTQTKSRLTYIARPPHDHQSRLPDLTKIKKLGWNLQTDLKTGINLTIKAMKN